MRFVERFFKSMVHAGEYYDALVSATVSVWGQLRCVLTIECWRKDLFTHIDLYWDISYKAM